MPADIDTAFWKFTGTVWMVPDFRLPDNYHLYIIDLDPSKDADRFLAESFPHFYEDQLAFMPVLDRLAGIA